MFYIHISLARHQPKNLSSQGSRHPCREKSHECSIRFLPQASFQSYSNTLPKQFQSYSKTIQTVSPCYSKHIPNSFQDYSNTIPMLSQTYLKKEKIRNKNYFLSLYQTVTLYGTYPVTGFMEMQPYFTFLEVLVMTLPVFLFLK